MADYIADWYQISIALESILSRFHLNLELSDLGGANRLVYSQIETIFYHLFLIIDSAKCRRKFWQIFPSRTSIEKSSFINEAILFIDNLKLKNLKVTKSIFMMCGGEPFRRLLVAVIEKAFEVEVKNVEERVSMLQASRTEKSCDHDDLPKELEQARQVALEQKSKLHGSIVNYKQEKLRIARLEEKVSKLREKLSKKNDVNQSNDDWKENIKMIFERCESVDSRRKNAMEQLRNMSILDNNSPVTTTRRLDKHESSIRMSSIWRSIRQKLDSEECDGEELKISADKIPQILLEHDEKLNKIITTWEETLDQTEEREFESMLKQPESKERYETIVKDMPFMSIESINLEPPNALVEQPSFDEVWEIFKEYQPDGIDLEEVREALKLMYRN